VNRQVVWVVTYEFARHVYGVYASKAEALDAIASETRIQDEDVLVCEEWIVVDRAR